MIVQKKEYGWRDYTHQNCEVVKVGMRHHVQTVGKRILIEMLRKVAERMVNQIDAAFTPAPPHEPGGNPDFPVWRGHMHDATGVAIYDEGTVIDFRPTRKSIKIQFYHKRPVDGPKELQQAISNGLAHFSKGLWIVLYSSVPYAMQVNTSGSPWERGKDYFNVMSEDFYKDIMTGLEVTEI